MLSTHDTHTANFETNTNHETNDIQSWLHYHPLIQLMIYNNKTNAIHSWHWYYQSWHWWYIIIKLMLSTHDTNTATYETNDNREITATHDTNTATHDTNTIHLCFPLPRPLSSAWPRITSPKYNQLYCNPWRVWSSASLQVWIAVEWATLQCSRMLGEQ